MSKDMKCPVCGNGQLVDAVSKESVKYKDKIWYYLLQFSKCDACGTEITSYEQSLENKKATARANLQVRNLR